jgi:hypothetical protein
MACVLVIENKVKDRWEVIGEGFKIDPDDPRYGDEVHLIPVHETKEESKEVLLGLHQTSCVCMCNPRVEASYGRDMVIHNRIVN